MKLVIGYFGPYLSIKQNISQLVVEKLSGIDCPKILFPVCYDKKAFLKPLYQYKPDVYLILAHNPKGKIIQVELRGNNERVDIKNKNSATKPILKSGLKYEVASFKPKLVKNMIYSENAGHYVCNFCIYTILREVRLKKLKTRLCFLHIPGKYGPGRAFRDIKTFYNPILNLKKSWRDSLTI